ncbi:31212_t:CDS:2, partial [Racocetra persica]
RSEIETMIRDAITKNTKDLNKKCNQQKVTKPRDNKSNKGIMFNNADVRLVEFREKGNRNEEEYLKVELLDKNECGDIRVFRKRNRKDDINEVMEPSVKREKIQESGLSPEARSEITKALTRRKKNSNDDQNVKIRIIRGVLQDDKTKSNVVP